jgi:choice-of-anchor B domain-containing protein
MKKLTHYVLTAAAFAAVVSPSEVQGQFGADLDVIGNQILVGEPSRVLGPGVIYIYEKQGDQWSESALLSASDGEVSDQFGAYFEAEGDHLLVATTNGIYAYQRTASGWNEAGKVQAADVVSGDGFGQAMAIHGNMAMIGAPGQGDNTGAVYVFRYTGDGWGQVGAKLMAEGEGTQFGASVAFDGENLIVGAPLADSRVGAAYAYRYTANGLQPAAALEVPGLSGRTQFGQGVWVGEGWALVQAPFANQATGAVFGYFQGEDGQWEPAGRLSAFDGGPRTIFGAALAPADGAILVGAPGADGFLGATYAFHEEDGMITGVTKILPAEGISGQAQTGGAIAAQGSVAVIGVTGADYGAGSVMVVENGPDGWSTAGVLASAPEGFDPVTGEEVGCSDGEAAGWDCSEVDLVSFLPVSELAGPGGGRGIRTNDNWGWQDPATGRQYALVGMTDRASFVDMSDPLNPRVVGILPMPETANGSAWRDIKTYENHAFIVSDGAGAHGMQVFDLTRLRDVTGDPVVFEADAHYTQIASAHNIVINEDTGFAFSVGSSSGGETCGGGLHIIDVREPKNPNFAGCFSDPQTGRASTGYTHDAQCVTYSGPDADYQGREICFGANETALSIADVTDKENTVALSRASYPSVGYSHQGWLSEDQQWFFMNDELDELNDLVERTRTLIWDVSDLDDPQLVAEHLGEEESSDHNLYVVGNLMYQSNYQSGLRILDIEDPANPVEVAYFDTVPYGDNGAGFGGSWSNFPFFENGLVIVTSGNEGLFLVRPTIRRTVF